MWQTFITTSGWKYQYLWQLKMIRRLYTMKRSITLFMFDRLTCLNISMHFKSINNKLWWSFHLQIVVTILGPTNVTRLPIISWMIHCKQRLFWWTSLWDYFGRMYNCSSLSQISNIIFKMKPSAIFIYLLRHQIFVCSNGSVYTHLLYANVKHDIYSSKMKVFCGI